MKELVSCHICKAAEVEPIPGYGKLCRVTSDCRPWPSGGHLGACRVCGTLQKPVDAAWQSEVQQIYDAYSIYHQSAGSEQSVFEPATGAAASRSSQLLKCLRARVQLPPTGRLLDVGCGNGAFLRAFSSSLPSWTLAGTEIGDKYRAIVESIHGVEALYTCPLDQVPGSFDLITMVHVLEHIPGPRDVIRLLREKLNPDGLLLIEVPNYTQNPFDLLIADHCTHFSAATLSSVVQDAGFYPVSISTDWVPKELSMVARAAGQTNLDTVQSTGSSLSISDNLRWLESVAAEGRSLSGTDSFGLFGTSIAATWLAGELGDKVTFFVDEDTSRVGRKYMDKPVYHPDSVPAGSRVFVALPPQVSENLKVRLMQKARKYELCMPPPFPGMAG